MKRWIHYSILVLTVTGLSVLAAEPFDLFWNTIDSGGVMRSSSADGVFELSGSIGQPDAGVLAGGAFKLTGGFWFETPPGDCDGNGIRDLGDHADFIHCMTGPDENATDECRCFDADGSGTVDLRDFKESQNDVVAH